MTEEQIDRLLAALETIGENLSTLSDGVWEVNENIERIIGSAANDRNFLRVLDVGRD